MVDEKKLPRLYHETNVFIAFKSLKKSQLLTVTLTITINSVIKNEGVHKKGGKECFLL
jgi:hypothetical protein